MPRPATSSARIASSALLLATISWGWSFTLSKACAAAINHDAHLPDGSPLGAVLLLAIRFGLAGVAWFVLIPAARRGWTWNSVLRSLALGLMLGIASVAQQMGLDRTSEAMSAFLTSLTFLFVPMMMALVLRRPPRKVIWFAVVLVTVGIWLLTGVTGGGFKLGEFLGLACAFLFSIHIILLNQIATGQNPWLLTGGEFLTSSIVCFACCPFLAHGSAGFLPAATPALMWNLLPLVLLPTMLSFGIQMFFQPKLDPSRAALIYLLEPVFAAVFAPWHYPYSWHYPISFQIQKWLGAALILFANVLVEWPAPKARPMAPEPIVVPPPAAPATA